MPPKISLRSRVLDAKARLRSVQGAYALAPHRNVPSSVLTPPFSIFAWWNPAGSGKTLYLRRAIFAQCGASKTGGVPGSSTVAWFYYLYRATAISGGVSLNTEIETKATRFTPAVANAAVREIATDAAISATLGQVVRRGNTPGWGWQTRGLMLDAIPDPEVNDQWEFASGEGLVLQVANALPLAVSFMPLLEWEEV